MPVLVTREAPDFCAGKGNMFVCCFIPWISALSALLKSLRSTGKLKSSASVDVKLLQFH